MRCSEKSTKKCTGLPGKRCSKKAVKGRTRCHTCARRKWAENNPEKYAYYTLKYNALRRGKVFTLSFQVFLKFCFEENYISKKGRTAQSLTIDRPRQDEGYTDDNIQALPNAENVRKAWRELVYDWKTREAYVIRQTETVTNIENPF